MSEESTYELHYDDQANVLWVGFGKKPAQIDEIVKEVHTKLAQMVSTGVITGGEIIKVNGPCAVIVAYTLAHWLGHRFSAVAVYDSKLPKPRYVIAVAHGDRYAVGDRVDGPDTR